MSFPREYQKGISEVTQKFLDGFHVVPQRFIEGC